MDGESQSPYPSPQLLTGEVRTERFYYDGVRRVQEVVIDPVLSLGEALAWASRSCSNWQGR